MGLKLGDCAVLPSGKDVIFKKKNAESSPGQELANRCEYTLPVSEVHAEVTDKAGPAGPEPDQLGFIVSIWLSVRPCRPPLDEMQAEGINV